MYISRSDSTAADKLDCIIAFVAVNQRQCDVCVRASVLRTHSQGEREREREEERGEGIIDYTSVLVCCRNMLPLVRGWMILVRSATISGRSVAVTDLSLSSSSSIHISVSCPVCAAVTTGCPWPRLHGPRCSWTTRGTSHAATETRLLSVPLANFSTKSADNLFKP